MKKILLISFLSVVKPVYSQDEANNWYFGFNAGITFSTNPPTYLPGGLVYTPEGCATISDNSGNLLFYSDGITVWDKTHAVMLNGTGLLGDPSSTQSCIFLPKPGSSSLYYIISAPVNTGSDPLAWSVVDMTMNGGNGAVTFKNNTLMAQSAEKLTAVYHQNGTDIWIIAHGKTDDSFHAFLLTASGIGAAVVSNAGIPFTNTYFEIGYLKASPCGNQLAMADWSSSGISTVELFDFDNTTGIVSNALTVGQFAASSGAYGVEFSPDNSKLYASIITPAFVVQYDLLAGSPAAIIASQDTIGTSVTNFNGALQTGPDGRIYLVKFGSNSLACIPNPNQSGAACGYIENYVQFTNGQGQIGLPDFFASYFCNIPSGFNAPGEEEEFSISPNPFENTFSVMVNGQNKKHLTATIYNLLGESVFFLEEKNSSVYTKNISLDSQPKGIYFLEMVIDGKRNIRKLLKL